MVPIDVAARVWMLLGGRKASIFRKNLAELFIRVLGGDERLAEEIKEIGEFQDSLPTNHPLRAFHDTTARTSTERSEEDPPAYIPKRTFGTRMDENVDPSERTTLSASAPRIKRICAGTEKEIVSKGASRPGQHKFRNLVINRVRFHGGVRCEASGAVRDLDAAHIVPYSHDGHYSHGSWATNGLLLHRAIHTVWDAGLVKLKSTPPFRWVDIDKDGINAMYGGLGNGIISSVEHKSLRADILNGMTSEDQTKFMQNLSLRFHL